MLPPLTVPAGLLEVLQVARAGFGAPSFVTFTALVTGYLGRDRTTHHHRHVDRRRAIRPGSRLQWWSTTRCSTATASACSPPSGSMTGPPAAATASDAATAS
jgi:hypothetical protein